MAGIFGQKNIWSPKDLYKSPGHRLPDDIRREGSAMTLKVLNAGGNSRWVQRWDNFSVAVIGQYVLFIVVFPCSFSNFEICFYVNKSDQNSMHDDFSVVDYCVLHVCLFNFQFDPVRKECYRNIPFLWYLPFLPSHHSPAFCDYRPYVFVTSQKISCHGSTAVVTLSCQVTMSDFNKLQTRSPQFGNHTYLTSARKLRCWLSSLTVFRFLNKRTKDWWYKLHAW